MIGLRVAASVAVLAVVSSGCMRSYPALQPEVRVTPTVDVAPAPIVAARCPRDGAGLAHAQGRAIGAGSRPNGFVPVRVIRCPVVDKAGRACRPRIPVDACGQPQQPVLDALAAITWTSNGSFPVVWR
ncbi:MAG TPA: hypothetical protein VIM10_17070 [Actinopolymorphaceae bacterium]